jgi:hypothetical protein
MTLAALIVPLNVDFNIRTEELLLTSCLRQYSYFRVSVRTFVPVKTFILVHAGLKLYKLLA